MFRPPVHEHLRKNQIFLNCSRATAVHVGLLTGGPHHNNKILCYPGIIIMEFLHVTITSKVHVRSMLPNGHSSFFDPEPNISSTQHIASFILFIILIYYEVMATFFKD